MSAAIIQCAANDAEDYTITPRDYSKAKKKKRFSMRAHTHLNVSFAAIDSDFNSNECLH